VNSRANGATTATWPEARSRLSGLLELAVRGLPAMVRTNGTDVVQTVRAARTVGGVVLRPEGQNLRYAAICALGLARTSDAEQRHALRGRSAAELASTLATRAADDADPGAVALAAWATAEVLGEPADELLAQLVARLKSGQPAATVNTAWALTCAIASTSRRAEELIELTANRLLAAQGAAGIFPHALPPESLGRWRAHVGCFADQVYPIQALARLAAATGDAGALEAANACAARICALQGPAGQWWWHYDSRDGTVVEGYPVYSVHQHAMAPMALLELAEVGGAAHHAEIAAGLGWLETHPEVLPELVNDRLGVVWRKVGRREPPKAARSLSAVTTSLAPGFRLPGLDRVFPPDRIDYECRPYELGWLLYAWLPDRVGRTDDGGKEPRDD